MMKRFKWAVGVAVSCALFAGNAEGQQARQPQSQTVAHNTYDYYDYYGQPEVEDSPSDRPTPHDATKHDEVLDFGSGCGCIVEDCCNYDACDPCEPWRLFGTGPRGFFLGGWIEGGATVNADSPASRFNGPVTFNDQYGGLLNQFYVYGERAVDTGGCGWDFGGRIDLLYGSDYIFTQSTGLETRRNGDTKWNSNQYYGLAMPQIYGEIGYNDLSVKLGHFYTVIGYEGVMAPNAFFYSHSYTHQYGEPFTHTGAQFTYAWSDQLDIVAGIVNGWDKTVSVEGDNRAAFVGGLFWTSYSERTTIGLSGIIGDELNGVDEQTKRYLYSLVITQQIGCNWQYVLQHDNGWQDNYFADGGRAEWYGVNQYLFYTFNDCWKAGARLEWFRDNNGVRVQGVRPANPLPDGFAGNFWELTLGVNWTPTNNFIVRPELRYDWYNGPGMPFDDGNSNSQFLAAIDAIFLF